MFCSCWIECAARRKSLENLSVEVGLLRIHSVVLNQEPCLRGETGEAPYVGSDVARKAGGPALPSIAGGSL